MKSKLLLLFLTGLLIRSPFLSTAQSAHSSAKTDSLLEKLLKQYPEYFGEVLQHPDLYKIQIIYTQIDRDQHNVPVFKDYYFHADSASYFYPASTVKLPVALLSLQKINELRLPGLDRNSTMITEKSAPEETPVYNDPGTVDGRPSVSSYIKKLFLVSDNDAFNRLYEFLGQDYINEQLKRMGYGDARIVHRLSIPLSEEENRRTNATSFYDLSNRTLYKQPAQASSIQYAERNDFLGKSYYDENGALISQPMNFSKKNRISLEDLHSILKSVLFPASVPAIKRFNLKEEDYHFLYQYMSQYPEETNYPPYDSANYWDAYGKLLFWGSEKGRLPKSIRIFNKEGDAYGFLTDVSYFVDFDQKVEFMLSATIYCNSDGVLNDDKYDYENVGLPFLKQLGRVIYAFDTKRKRNFQPDLYRFKTKYEK
jgi:Beta-lactamase enzyme family